MPTLSDQRGRCPICKIIFKCDMNWCRQDLNAEGIQCPQGHTALRGDIELVTNEDIAVQEAFGPPNWRQA